MLRSHSQVLYSYLPGAVFRHEERVYGRVVSIDGNRLTALNEAVIFEEIAGYLERWPEDDRHDLPLPRGMRTRDYRIIRPDLVRWELFPLILECARRSCARVRSFRTFDDLASAPRCRRCGGTLQQLRFYNTHNCGHIRPIHVPRCTAHGYDELSFDNTGSFLTATWRCHGPGCDGGVVHRTNMSPCSCNRWPGSDGVVRMRAHTLDDSRAYQAHSVDLVNIDSSVFQTYQRHPARGQIATAHFLGLIEGIKEGIQDSDTTPGTARLTTEEWSAKEQAYIAAGLTNDEIAILKRASGPAASGLAALGSLAPGVFETVAERRPFYERAAVFDHAEVPRTTLSHLRDQSRQRSDDTRADRLATALDLSARMGIRELSVSWEFPIAKIAFGYTREQHGPGDSAIRGFRHPRQNDGKYPVYAVATTTEALLITLSAPAVLAFLHTRGETAAAPPDEDSARRQLLAIFAAQDAQPAPAGTIRVLIHTLSHLLLRGLDDGQIGFAESSLAEWLVPETLTLAVYANNLKDFTLGSLWTLLNNRAHAWLSGVAARAIHCENDPICYQNDPRSCERCAYLTFGCRLFNDDLDRRLLYDFLLSRGALGMTPETAR